MAMSGGISGLSYSGMNYNNARWEFAWTATQTGIRQTTISWTLKSVGRTSSPTWYATNAYLYINGVEEFKFTKSWSGDGDSSFSFNNVSRDSGSFIVTHDSNGNASFTAQLKSYVYNLSLKDSGVITFTLNKNPSVLTLNPNGGSVSPTTVEGYNGMTYTVPNPSRAGHTFNNWSKSGTGTLSGTTFTFGLGDCTLTASWTAINYTFTLGSGTGGSTSGSTTSGSYACGTTITLKATANAGYKFVRWQSSNTSLVSNKTVASTTFSMPAGNITMTPVFEVNGTVRIYNGSSWQLAIPYIYNGSSWQQAIPYVYNGSSWKQCGG